MNFGGFCQYLLSICRNCKDHLKTTFLNKCNNPACVRQPFSYDTTTADINSPYTDGIIELQKSKVKKRGFNTTNLQMFWCQHIESYPLIAKVALEVLMPFVTTYESMRFLFKLIFKAKKRSRIPCENDRELLFPRQSLEFYN